MRLKLKNTPEQVELVKAIGSRDQNVAREASEAFAAFLGPVIQKVLMTAGTASAIYSDSEYDEDDSDTCHTRPLSKSRAFPSLAESLEMSNRR